MSKDYRSDIQGGVQMLGKAIKNEFRNREHTVLVVLLLLLAGAILVKSFSSLDAKNITGMMLIYLLVFIAYLGIDIAAFVVAFISPIKDFRDRFFKDQGYLTHTLPLNIPTLIGARLIVDLAIMAQLILAGFICNWLAWSKDDMLDTLLSFIEMITSEGVDRAKITYYTILIVILVSVSYLSFLWLFCASYAIGHSLFNKHKKVITVVTAVIISSISYYFFVATLVKYISGDFGDMTSDGLIWLFTIVAGVLLVIFVLTVGIIFKKKLNLE